MQSTKKYIKNKMVTTLDRLGVFGRKRLTHYVKRLGGMIVVVYHSVTPDPELDPVMKGIPYSISAKAFLQQISALRRHFTIVDLKEVESFFTLGKQLPDRPCLITFDDGWLDNYSILNPLLQKERVPAVIFLSTDLVGTDNLDWTQHLWRLIVFEPDNLLKDLKLTNYLQQTTIKYLKKRGSPPPGKTQFILLNLISFDISKTQEKIRKKIICSIIEAGKALKPISDPPYYMSFKKIQNMNSSGITFGSHGHSHFPLTWFNEKNLHLDITKSKKKNENELEPKITAFSYPHSLLSDREVKAVSGTGFTTGFCDNNLSNPKTLFKKGAFNIHRFGLAETAGIKPDGSFSDPLFLYTIFKQSNLSKRDWFL